MRDETALVRWLQKAGFAVDETRTHVVIRHGAVPGAQVVMPQTTSDWRAFRNGVSQLRNEFAALESVDWDAVPGATRPRAREWRCEEIAGWITIDRLLRCAEDPKGEHLFAGRVETRSDGPTINVRVGNPFHVPYSLDPMRSQEHFTFAVDRNSYTPSAELIASLAVMGLDLRLGSSSAVLEGFTEFAAQQRRAMVAEHRAFQTWKRIAGDAYVGRASGRIAAEHAIAVR